MNYKDDNTCIRYPIRVTVSIVRILFLKHFKVFNSLKSGDCAWRQRNQTALNYTWIYD